MAIRAFYVRRCLRIWPLYFFFLAFCMVLSRLSLLPPIPAAQLLALLFFAGNFWNARHGFASSPADHLWSISVEEQFYLLWPWLASLGSRTVLLGSSVTGLLLAGGVILYAAGRAGMGTTAVAVNTAVNFAFFSAGTLLALLLPRRAWRAARGLRPLLFLAGLACWYLAVSLCHIRGHGEQAGPGALIAGYGLVAAGCALLLLAALGAAVPAWASPLVYLGRISYGLYVWQGIAFAIVGSMVRFLPRHSLLERAASVTLDLAVVVAIAALSYRFLETPFLRLKEKFTVAASRPYSGAESASRRLAASGRSRARWRARSILMSGRFSAGGWWS